MHRGSAGAAVLAQPGALHGALAAEHRVGLLQRGVELVGLALEVVERVEVDVHHLDELRELVRVVGARPGLPRALISETLPDDWKETASRLKLSALHLNHEVVNAAMVEEIHKTGLVVRVYTVNEEEDMDRMLAAGVDVMITDKPEAFL